MTQLTDMPGAVDSARQRKTPRRGSRAMTTAAGSHAVEARSLGLVIAGLGLARQPVLAGAGRWLPLLETSAEEAAAKMGCRTSRRST